MRSDDHLALPVASPPHRAGLAASLSGNERNRLFRNDGGGAFEDVSELSGADHVGDGRSFAVLDYDRDGWIDLAVVNANAPLLEVFRNQGALKRDPGSPGFVALRFVGSNWTSKPAPGKTARDGFGARAIVEAGERVLHREHRAGEGLAAQNSGTLVVGLGERQEVDRLVVRWPSGVEHASGPIAAGSLVTFYEAPSQSPTGHAVRVEPYARPAFNEPRREVVREVRFDPASASDNSAVRLYAAAAQCKTSCASEVPQLQALREAFRPDELAMYSIPEVGLGTRPPVTLVPLSALSRSERLQIEGLLERTRPSPDRAATLLTNSTGVPLLTTLGTPTVSDVRRFLSSPGA